MQTRPGPLCYNSYQLAPTHLYMVPDMGLAISTPSTLGGAALGAGAGAAAAGAGAAATGAAAIGAAACTTCAQLQTISAVLMVGGGQELHAGHTCDFGCAQHSLGTRWSIKMTCNSNNRQQEATNRALVDLSISRQPLSVGVQRGRSSQKSFRHS